MSEVSEDSRQDVVEENIENVIATYGKENVKQLLAVCIKDISVSLAMLVDAGASSGD